MTAARLSAMPPRGHNPRDPGSPLSLLPPTVNGGRRDVLINAQMSGFGDEAEILCSTRGLPVLDLKPS
jgi:hypothetical protein